MSKFTVNETGSNLPFSQKTFSTGCPVTEQWSENGSPETADAFSIDRMCGGPNILSLAECLIWEMSLLAIHSYN